MASYPTSIPAWANPRALNYPSVTNEITAIATELGTNPSGSSSTVKDRLDTIELLASTEGIQDTVNTMLIMGAGLGKSYDEGSGELTLTPEVSTSSMQAYVALIHTGWADAKGDILVATAADTVARLAVGTDGQVLTVDSAETTGLKWATPSGGGGGTTITVKGESGGTPTTFNNIDTLDFNAAGGFDFSESPSGEMNISLDLSEYGGSALPVAGGGTGGTDQASARSGLGLGTIATQAASAIAITGGTLTGITNLVATGGTVALTGVSSVTVSSGSTDAFTVANAGTGNAIQVTQTGNITSSSQNGGAINVTNTSNSGEAIVVYSNHASATANLVSIRADNTGYAGSPLYVENDGTSHAVSIAHASTDATANALYIASSNTADSAVAVLGSESGEGTVSILHTKPGSSDASASALQITLAGASTAAQGIVIDTAGGVATTGKLLNIKNNTSDRLVLNADGTATFAGDVTVPDEVYGSGWNGSLEVPTKNAVYDKIEALVLGGGGVTAFSDLSDVDVAGATTGATLIYNGSTWVDGQLDLADSDARTGVLPVANGGTGGTDQASARSGIGAAPARAVTTVTSSGTTMSTSADIVLMNSASSISLILPAPASAPATFTIKNIGIGVLTIDVATNSGTIDGSSTARTLYQWDALRLANSGTAFYIV